MTERTEQSIQDQADKAADQLIENNGASKWPGMSYEQGVETALRWVLGHSDEAPMDDE